MILVINSNTDFNYGKITATTTWASGYYSFDYLIEDQIIELRKKLARLQNIKKMKWGWVNIIKIPIKKMFLKNNIKIVYRNMLPIKIRELNYESNI
jgi:hypothetical protein